MKQQIIKAIKQNSWIILTLVLTVVTLYVIKATDKPKPNWEDYYANLYSTAYQTDFIDQLAEPAKNLHEESKLYPSIIIAQAILESDWGQSDLAKKANNLFGIKGEHNMKSVIMETDEYIDGERVTINDTFKKYDTISQSLEDHLVFLKGASYQQVLTAADYKEAAVYLQVGGYATDPNYADKLIELIEQFNLNKYDS